MTPLVKALTYAVMIEGKKPHSPRYHGPLTEVLEARLDSGWYLREGKDKPVGLLSLS